VSPTMTIPNTAVLAFQFEGCEYQPPAGDQTCLGYLARQIMFGMFVRSFRKLLLKN